MLRNAPAFAIAALAAALLSGCAETPTATVDPADSATTSTAEKVEEPKARVPDQTAVEMKMLELYKDGDWTTAKGTIRNVSSDLSVRYYSITVEFLDKNGKVICADFTNGLYLQPGQVRPWEVSVESFRTEKMVRARASIGDVH